MNLRKYFDLIVLLILLEITTNCSANEWKKLKRKLFALTLLHGIRVKTIIPVPLPIPLPVVIKKHITSHVLPQKRVPFLVPKPVPYYQIIPNFVPIYSNDDKSQEKHKWSEDSLISAPQMTHEDYLLPGDNPSLNYDFYKLSASDEQYSEHPFKPNAHPEEHSTDHTHITKNKFNKHRYHHDQFIDPFEQNSKHRFPKNSLKFTKQKSKPLNRLKKYNFKDEYFDKYSTKDGKYEDLLMLSTALKAEPQDMTASFNPYMDDHTLQNSGEVGEDHRLSNTGLSAGFEMNTQLLSDLQPNESNERTVDSPGAKTKTKRIKLGEIRLQHSQLKELLAHHTTNN